MGAHINTKGEFQSDKYPTCPPGKVPLSVKDPMAQDLLWDYAQRRRAVDAEFSTDLEAALLAARYRPHGSELEPLAGAIYQQMFPNCGQTYEQASDETKEWVRRVSRAVARAAPAAFGELGAELERLNALINTPTTSDWLEGVRLEAAHQQERWGTDHDAGKTDPDWFWLVGYLAGKALFAIMQGDKEKAKHHTISTGAALLNWWRHITGEATAMRPGIEPPAGD